MNSNKSNTTLLIASILVAFTLLGGSISVGNVYATGGLDDEEEEEAIEELQNEVSGINEALGNIELNLQEGANNIQANCPVNTDEIVEEIVEVIENVTQEQNVTETPQCPIVEEPQPNQTVLPPQVIAEPQEQNETEPVEGCNPIPEPVPENETSELEPIICPVNGELLGYTNTTSGEQLPISAGESNNTGFLPPIDIPTEPEQNQTITPEVEEPIAETPQCNVTTAPPAEEEPAPAAPVAPPEIEFDNGCGCYVNNGNGGATTEETSLPTTETTEGSLAF